TFQQKSLSLCLALAAGLTLALASTFSSAQDAAAPAAATPAAGAPVDTVGELATVPAPALTARAWMTLDVTSGQVIAAQNLDQSVEPASLTKLMAAYVVFDAIENNR